MADHPDLPGKSGFLSRKIIGVPLLYWLAIFVLILAYVAYRMKSAPADVPDVAPDPALAPENADDSSTSATDGFLAQATPTYTSGVAPSTTVETNESWAKKATEFVGASGLATYGDAQLAIQMYLDGDQLSYQQGRIRDAAIKQFGAPPEPITVGGTAPKPADAAKRQGTPPCYHTVKGPNDSYWDQLARLYWGSTSDERKRLLMSANTSLGTASGFSAGTRVFIPRYHAPKYYTSTKTINTLAEIAAKNATTVTALHILNANLKNTLKAGTKVRVA